MGVFVHLHPLFGSPLSTVSLELQFRLQYSSNLLIVSWEVLGHIMLEVISVTFPQISGNNFDLLSSDLTSPTGHDAEHVADVARIHFHSPALRQCLELSAVSTTTCGQFRILTTGRL